MAANIKIKRSELVGNPPVLGAGELAYSSLLGTSSNGGDRLYIGTGSETLGDAVNHVVIGGKYFTDMITAATNANTASAIVKRDASGNFSAGTISANLTGNVTGNVSGTALSITGVYAGTLTSAQITTALGYTPGSTGGTVTSVAALTLTSTAAADVSSTVADSTTAAVITLNIPTASASSRGALSPGDFSTFNSKLGSVSIAIANSGTDIGVDANSGTATAPILNIHVPTASVSNRGLLSAADWAIFNNKQAAGAYLTAESDTLASVTGRGATTATAVTFSGGISGALTGNVTGNAGTATKWATARDLSLTGDATATLAAVDGSAAVSAAVTLATVNTAVGTYGSSTSVAQFTVNAKGLITGVTEVAVAQAGAGQSYLDIAGNSGTDTVTTGVANQVLTFEGGTGVSTVVTNNKVSFAIGQSVATNANVSFNNLVLAGNLTVNGTTTSVNSTTVDVSDLNITVAKGSTTAAAANGAGLTVDGAGATLTYTSADDRWNFNKALTVSTVYGALVGNADTATKWATARDLSLTGDATATLTSVDGSAAVSAAVTLATVNSNTGNFGTATSVPSITVNAKGLITAIVNTAITTATTTVLGLASFAATDFTVTAGAVSIKAIDGGTY